MATDRRTLIRNLQRAGCTVEQGGKHLKVTAPDGRLTTIGISPATRGFGPRMEIAQLRSNGCPIDSKGNPLPKDSFRSADVTRSTPPADLGLCSKCLSDNLAWDASWKPPLRCLDCGSAAAHPWTPTYEKLRERVEAGLLDGEREESTEQPATLPPTPKPEEAPMTPTTPPKQPTGAASPQRGTARAVHRWFLTNKPESATSETVDEALGIGTRRATQALAVLAKTGRLQRLGHGIYRLPQAGGPGVDLHLLEIMDTLSSGRLLARGDDGKVYSVDIEVLG